MRTQKEIQTRIELANDIISGLGDKDQLNAKQMDLLLDMDCYRCALKWVLGAEDLVRLPDGTLPPEPIWRHPIGKMLYQLEIERGNT